MKKRLQLLGKPFFLGAFLLFLGSCQKDDFGEEHAEHASGIIEKRITFEELRTNAKAMAMLEHVMHLENPSAEGRIVTDSLQGFTVDTEEVLVLEYAGLHSLTFPVSRTAENSKLENLVLSLQRDGTYEAKLLSYDLTDTEKIALQENKLGILERPITTTVLADFNSGQLFARGCETKSEQIIVSCSEGVHNGSNVGDWPACTASTPPRIFTRTYTVCTGDSESDGGSGGSSGGNGGGGGSNENPSSGGSTGNDYQPGFPATPGVTPGEYEGGITVPVGPKKPPQNQQATDDNVLKPCRELKKLTDQTRIKESFEILGRKTSDIKEWGYAFKTFENSTGLQPPQIMEMDPNEPLKLNMKNYLGGNYIGASHTHPDRYLTGAAPMFSPEDIRQLGIIALRHNNNRMPTDSSPYVVTLTVGTGTYAIKIKDWYKFYAVVGSATGYVKFKDELTKLYFETNSETPIAAFEKILLNLIKDKNMGIGLYKANTGFDGWSELIIDPANPSNIAKQIPCN